MTNLLIIDDEKEVGNFLSHLFMQKGYRVKVVTSGAEFSSIDLTTEQFNVAMIDLKLPDTEGLTLLMQLKKKQPQCRAVIMTGYSTIKTAVDAMRLGASDYIEKPFDDITLLENQIDRLLAATFNSNKKQIHDIANKTGLIIGKNESMNHLVETAYKVADKNVNILIEGETGTGKEVLARFIHESSQRCHDSFIGVNCGALSESLLESELFGHEKGAFTGATQQRKGLFEIASKGTLFLDEIAEASPSIQVKLLRVLETREFMRVGSGNVLHTNARIIAASNENLLEAVKKKKFREDLFYRLNVVHLKIPPLNERKEDIPNLIRYFLERHSNSKIIFSEEATNILKEYSWPGNIRELSNFIARVNALSDHSGGFITPSTLPSPGNMNLPGRWKENEVHSSKTTTFNLETNLQNWVDHIRTAYANEDFIDLEEVLTEFKEIEIEIGKAFIHKTLKETLGNRKEAAKRLKISMRKLRYLLNEKSETPMKNS